MKVAFLIPSTSKGRDQWKDIKDSYLYNYTVKSFLLTQDPEHEYCFYIGYDEDDRIYAKKTEQEMIGRFSLVFKNVSFKFIPMNVEKGFLTKMWNILFQQAYNDGYEYFYQTGDDINFRTKGWVNASIDVLKQNNDIGLSGPINNNNRILTQAMVSRKHMEIFGFFFPEQIKNWCCDDWYNMVYSPKYFYPIKTHYCSNDGGNPRYQINNDPAYMLNFQRNTQQLRIYTSKLADRHKKLIQQYVQKTS